MHPPFIAKPGQRAPFTDRTRRCGSAILLRRSRARIAPFLVLSAMLAGTGCGGAQMQVRGATYDLNGAEADLAAEYERQDPTTAPSADRCTYWQAKVGEAQGGHVIGIVKWPADHFAALQGWVGAKRDDACKDVVTKQTQPPVMRVVQVAQGPAEPPSPAAPDPTARAAQQQASEAELRSGKCSANHAAALQGLLQQTKMMFDSIGHGTSSDWFTLVSSDVLVASPQGTRVPQDSLAGGEFHVLAAASEPVSLDVKDAHGNVSALRSTWERAITGLVRGGHTDSRVLQVNTLRDATVSVKGGGCVLVVVFEKH